MNQQRYLYAKESYPCPQILPSEEIVCKETGGCKTPDTFKNDYCCRQDKRYKKPQAQKTAEDKWQGREQKFPVQFWYVGNIPRQDDERQLYRKAGKDAWQAIP
jgi:hypothetical protein